MIVWICTDMEGLAGVDRWDQCYPDDNSSPGYQYAREQLTAEANAAAAGCFDAGATEVRVMDGHGHNEFRGFITEKLDPRIRCVARESDDPVRLEGLDETVTALAIIGQHAMAGTINGFLDHTGSPKTVCRLLINGQEHGEVSRLAMYAGYYGIPLVYASGDEALCEEMRRLFPHVVTTPTKRGTGWETCELYPADEVRKNIRRDIALSLKNVDRSLAWRLQPPIEITLEFAWSGIADEVASRPRVQRVNARTVRQFISDPRNIFTWPSP